MENNSSLLDVLKALRQNIFKNLKVATLGIVKQVDATHKTLSVQVFPKDEEAKTTSLISCRYLNEGATVGDIVLVLFLDRNFLANLSRIENGINDVQTVSSNVSTENLHSEKFGIAIKTL